MIRRNFTSDSSLIYRGGVVTKLHSCAQNLNPPYSNGHIKLNKIVIFIKTTTKEVEQIWIHYGPRFVRSETSRTFFIY